MPVETSRSSGAARERTNETLVRLERALASQTATVDAPTPREAVRGAAVAIILRIAADDVLELLLIERARFEGDPWSGHMAFPGGRREPSDDTLLATAIRETREETGIDLSIAGRALGALSTLGPTSPVLPRLSIAPYVFLLSDSAPLALSEEVADAFWIPIALLQHVNATREVAVPVPGGTRTVRAFVHGRYTIWGLTERILRELLSRVTP